MTLLKRLSIVRRLSYYRIVKHTVPCQHTREYPGGAEIGRENDLQLAVKQYIPLDNPDPKPGDVTFIASHANGFPKELYEPLWYELYRRSRAVGFRIRGIWIADVASQGESGVLNETALGNESGWWDHSRDLLYLINQKQKLMPQPLMGIGHSMGGTQLANLSLIHPRLLKALILIDPVIQRRNPGLVPGTASTHRRDIWPSREDAAERFAGSKFYQAWDSRVFDQWIQYGLRDLPTETYPLSSTGQIAETAVTLTTTKHQEVFSFLRPTYQGEANVPPRDDKTNYADLDPENDPSAPFYRPEPSKLLSRLPELRPSVLYIFGGKSELSPAPIRQEIIDRTGVGVGGSGGVANGRVQHVTLQNRGHLVPMEDPLECADVAAEFIGSELRRWNEEFEAHKTRWQRMSRQDRVSIDETWKEKIGERQAKGRKEPP